MRTLTIIFTLLFSINCYALETEWHSTEGQEGQIRMITSGHDADGNIMAGLQFKFKPHWHTYWKHPGETGTPIVLTDTGSHNIKNFEVMWPAPKRIITFDIESWIYENEVIIPVKITREDNTKEVQASFEVKWAVCNEMCLFEKSSFSLKIAPDYMNSSNFAAIENFLKSVPVKLEASKTKLDSFDILPDKIISQYSSDTQFNDSVDLLIAEPSKNFKFPKPEISFSADRKKITVISPYLILLSGEKLDNKTLYVTLASGENSVEFEQLAGGKITVKTSDKLEITTEKKTLKTQ
ncbi:MAG TPA: hypothetical protein DIV86_02435 [Alphaproteobacteria bacterium]|nr:hypothetical protein [Alphaproteobacteria bacterium]